MRKLILLVFFPSLRLDLPASIAHQITGKGSFMRLYASCPYACKDPPVIVQIMDQGCVRGPDSVSLPGVRGQKVSGDCTIAAQQ